MKVRCIIKNKNQDKILLCYYKKGEHYFLPGGSIEFQETAEKAIYRELEEELGLKKSKVKVGDPRGVIENIFANKHEFDLLFNVSIENEDIYSKENQIDFFWKNLSEIEDIDVRPTIVKKILKNDVGKYFLNIDL